MCLVQDLDGIFFQNVVQMYLLSVSSYGPIFPLFFFMGGTWAIGHFRYFVAFQRESSVLLSWVSSVRNLLIDDCLMVLISLDNCWLTLFRILSCGFLDSCHFLQSLRFSDRGFQFFFGKLRHFSFVLITGVLFHAASWIAVITAFRSLYSWSAVLSSTDRLIVEIIPVCWFVLGFDLLLWFYH
jgi:hypothetical protein